MPSLLFNQLFTGLQHKFVVWSVKHQQWWGPNHAGYTKDLEEAGLYTAEECDEIEKNSQCAGSFDQVSVRIPVRYILLEKPHA